MACTIHANISKKMKNVRRFGTKLRDEEIKRRYEQLADELGDVARFVSRDYYYKRLSEETGLSVRTLSHILNHC